MRLLPLIVFLLSLSSLFISFPPTQVAANSLGFGIPCDVANPILGSDNQARPGANDPVRAMWWTKKPAWAGTRYTLRTSDTGTVATDPTSYVPGQWVELHLRTHEEDRQFNGLLMYAETVVGAKKVGEWYIPPRQDFRVDPTSGCVTHKNADRKAYYSTFRVKFPAGTGQVKIKALLKYGLPFPALEGLFLWLGPGTDFLTLNEAPQQATTWYQGAVGESCNTVCRKQNLGCDVNAMKGAMANPSSFYDQAKKSTTCTLPLMRGCSSATPSVGENGCYYHDDTCTRLPVAPVWERADPCAPLAAYQAGKAYQGGECCKYQNFKWCANYYINSAPEERQYGPWSKSVACMPAGGYPVEAAPVIPPPRPAAQIDCSTIFSSPLDGNRICACAGAAVPGQTDPPTQPPATSGPQITTRAPSTTAPPATSSPIQKACNTPYGDKTIGVTSNGFAYQFSHIPGVDNPSLDLVIGRKYSFVLDASISGGNHPFAIKTQQSLGTADLVSSMYVTNNNVKEGTVTFTPGADSTLYYQCSVHSSMTNFITFVNADDCGQRGTTTVAPISTTTTSAPVTTSTQRSTTTTTLPPDSCAVVNCGRNGQCSFGKCACLNGYTGTLCQTAPTIACNVNCKSQNRGACTTDNVCGQCLPGYKLVGVNCVVECDTQQCGTLNRLTCTAPSQCGACNSGFVEPVANNKNYGLSCISAAMPATTSAPNDPAPNPNGYKFEIGAQWQSGFCGTVSGAVDPNNLNIEFMLPKGLVMASSWNLGASYDPSTGIVTGTLPDWVKYGGGTFSGGLCANFAYDPTTLIQTNTVGFTKAVRSAKSLASAQSIDQYDVVITVQLKDTTTASIDGDDKFVLNFVAEAAKLIGVKPFQVSFLRHDRIADTTTAVSFNVHCSSTDQISLTVAFPESLKSLQALITVTVDNKPSEQRATEYVALYPNLSKADATKVAMTFPTEIYSDNSAAEPSDKASSASHNYISGSLVAALAVASLFFARW